MVPAAPGASGGLAVHGCRGAVDRRYAARPAARAVALVRRPGRPVPRVRTPRDPTTTLQVIQPTSWTEALQARADHPAARVLAGGTQVVLDLTAGRRPVALLDLSRVAGSRAVERDGDVLVLGAGVTYTAVLETLASALPGLAAAARTVASVQVRNRATLVGALVLGDPSSDAGCALAAVDAEVVLAKAGGAGERRVPVGRFVTAPGACDLRADELVVALRVPVARGPQAYAKTGARNAMARAVCGVAVALDVESAAAPAAIALGGVAPTLLRARDAEALLAAEGLGPAALARAAALAAAGCAPASDDRASAAHRRRVAEVLTRRALERAVAELPWR